MDDEGFLYFVGRRDEMIKTSGYRVSPTEVEEVVYATELVTEVAALGVTHPVLGQAVVLVVYGASPSPQPSPTRGEGEDGLSPPLEKAKSPLAPLFTRKEYAGGYPAAAQRPFRSQRGGFGAVGGEGVAEKLLAACKQQLPAFMVPAQILVRDVPLPRNPNGKIDRKALGLELAELFAG